MEKERCRYLETEDVDKSEKSLLVYDKVSENLIEISLAFANLKDRYEKLCDIDSITWKQMFVDWANEFETVYTNNDWDQCDYLHEIEKYARKKILEYAGLEDSFIV